MKAWRPRTPAGMIRTLPDAMQETMIEAIHAFTGVIDRYNASVDPAEFKLLASCGFIPVRKGKREPGVEVRLYGACPHCKDPNQPGMRSQTGDEDGRN